MIQQFEMYQTTRTILFLIVPLLICCSETPTRQQTANSTIPLILNGESTGCGFFFVYKGTQDKTKLVMVSGEYGKLMPMKTPQTLDIGQTAGLEVRLYDYGDGTYRGPCEASVSHGRIVEQSNAIAGRVTIFITRETIKDQFHDRAFAITVILEHVTFPASNGKAYYIEKAEMTDVVVGTQSG